VGHIFEGLQVFCFFLKIPKAGEKIKDVVKSDFPEGLPHVMRKKVEVVVLKLPGKVNALRREVKARHIVPLASQVAGVAPFAASQVEHVAAGRRMERIEEMINEAFRFGLIPIFV
jgi:hypothetical protein